MRTITAVPVIALLGGLTAGVAHADDPAPAAWTAIEPRAEPGDDKGGGRPAGAFGNVWGVQSAAEREARAIADSERGALPAATSPMPTAPAAPAPAVRQPRGGGGVDVGRLALSTLARHAARAMGQDNARVLGLDAIAPTVESPMARADAPPPAPAAPHARTVAFQPGSAGEGSVSSRDLPGARASTRPRHAQLAQAPPNTRLASAYDELIDEVARRHDVAPHLVRAVIKVESNFQPNARSPKGAVGLMQVMPATGRRFGAADLRDPRSNLSAGTQYLRWLLNRFDEDLTLALAAYNAGEGAVEKYGRRIPPFAETQGYVSKVLAHLGLTPGTEAASLRAVPTAGGDVRGNGGTTDEGSGAKPGRTARAGGNDTVARQQADAALRSVSNWLGAVLTSSARPPSRAATEEAATDRTATDRTATGRVATVPAMAADASVDGSTWTRLPLPVPVRRGPA
ncbi:lytic transglycosylase domain-containing protein [Cupriavidus sp. JZ107]